MIILAFDTCFNACSVAVGIERGGAVETIAGQHEVMSSGQAERLIPMIAETLAQAGQNFAAVGRIAVTTGPGSFTGTRIGVAAAKALALDRNIPVTALSSLQLIARQTAVEQRPQAGICVAVDVRRNELYIQVFDKTGMIAQTAPALMTADSAREFVRTSSVILVGNGVTMIAEPEAMQPDGNVAMPPPAPHARYAFDLLLAGGPQANTGIAPLYLRAPDAKPPSAAPLQRL